MCVIPSYYERFGLVGLESLFCGTPGVATDTGDLKNIIIQGETGYVVPDNSPQQLADKINLILSRPEPDEEATLKIRASVSRLSWANIAEAFLREIQPVLSGDPNIASGHPASGCPKCS